MVTTQRAINFTLSEHETPLRTQTVGSFRWNPRSPERPADSVPAPVKPPLTGAVAEASEAPGGTPAHRGLLAFLKACAARIPCHPPVPPAHLFR